MRSMSEEEARAFLLERARTGMLATTRGDGRPHAAPVWFDLDGDEVVFTSWHESVKAANMRRDPRVLLAVDDEVPPYAYVLVEGTATLLDEAPDLLAWATRIATRYLGAELGPAYGARNGVTGELLVRVRPTRIVAHAGITD